MDNKDKIIEEMAKEIECAKQGIWNGETPRNEDEDYLWHSRRIAEYLTKLGYRKLPENARVILDSKDQQYVVLSKEEYDNLKLEIQQAHHKGVQAGFDMTKFKEHSIERKASKETVEKILKFLKEHLSCMGFSIVKAYFKEQFGVEIKE